MKIYNKLFPILSNSNFACSICGHIVYLLKKFELEVEDHHRGQIQQLIYGLRETEWKNKLATVKDREVDSNDHFYLFVVKTKFEWKGIELGISDLPWMLRHNRYKINSQCYDNWYYRNGEYFFEDVRDKRMFETIARRYLFLDDKY